MGGQFAYSPTGSFVVTQSASRRESANIPHDRDLFLSFSHAMMDLLVELCLQNHLNPSNHALEIRSSETQQPLNFKPNTLVGTLNAHTVFLKEKVPEAKVKAGPAKVPEVSSTRDPLSYKAICSSL